MSFQIAIDGPVASGKGTVARLVAESLGMMYVDTGAMYRAVAYAALQRHISLDNETALISMIRQLKIELHQPQMEERDGRLMTVLLDGSDISWAIRSEAISSGASRVAVFAGIRQQLVKLQQTLAAKSDVVMEGRDITYRVLPNAQLKIFLTASIEKRSERRLLELQKSGHPTTYDQVYQDLQQRDRRDSQRTADPLQVGKDVWVLDTSDLSIPQVVDQIVGKVKGMRQ